MNSNFQQINLEQLESVSFGDEEFKKELIEIFLEQIPEFISNMKKFYSDGNYMELAKEAHTAKSSVLIFGMEKTGTALKDIQLQGEKNITENLSELLNGVVSELNIAKLELEEILAEL